MAETKTVTINVYGGSPSGHASITLGAATYEQQWDQSSYAGLFTSRAGPNDGRIQIRPSVDPVSGSLSRSPAVSLSFDVSVQEFESAEAFARSQLGINNYG